MQKSVSLIFLFLLFINCSTSKEKKIDEYVFKTKKEKTLYLTSYNKALQLWQVPYKEENIATSFGTAHIIISGPKDAKPVVLLHGMDASSTMWFPNSAALSKNHRVYAIDFLMEAGKSELKGKSLTSDEIVNWYEEIFNYYNLKNFDIIGASRGGWFATLLTIQKNKNINKLVLISPAQTFNNVDQKGKASTAMFLKFFPNKKKLNKTLDAFSYYPNKINSVYKNQFYLANKYSKSNASFLQMRPFSDDELKGITIPVLVLIGGHDVINSEKSLLRANEYISNCKTATIKNSGHFVSMDQSKEVDKMIVDFLK
ncbi:alpha/beta fold hydrolase [Flavobacterium sp. N3904]|uniref:alpha/beta fold hydrolase n=1 Tax=Flavobacterium sp. N3904 TaxID=2986835 RepID=UPI0022246A3E|nr:alpha/beta hydrolase [Flavobacterium sp. N3904]